MDSRLAVLAAAAVVTSDHQPRPNARVRRPETYADRLDKLETDPDAVPTPPSAMNSKESIGRWTNQEQGAFIVGLKRYGRNWKRVQRLIKTRTLTQIRTHAQKFFRKVRSVSFFRREAGVSDTPP